MQLNDTLWQRHHTFTRDWLRFRISIVQKMDQLSGRTSSLRAIRPISTAPSKLVAAETAVIDRDASARQQAQPCRTRELQTPQPQAAVRTSTLRRRGTRIAEQEEQAHVLWGPYSET